MLAVRFPMRDTAAPFPYIRIASQAARLRSLGLSDSAIARSLGVSDKTVAKALRRADDSTGR